MPLPYQSDPIVLGKWYVSELPPVRRLGPGSRIDSTYHGAHNARLAGPYNSEAEASAAGRDLGDPEYATRLYIWQPGGQ